jgi:hypothetical protein
MSTLSPNIDIDDSILGSILQDEQFASFDESFYDSTAQLSPEVLNNEIQLLQDINILQGNNKEDKNLVNNNENNFNNDSDYAKQSDNTDNSIKSMLDRIDKLQSSDDSVLFNALRLFHSQSEQQLAKTANQLNNLKDSLQANNNDLLFLRLAQDSANYNRLEEELTRFQAELMTTRSKLSQSLSSNPNSNTSELQQAHELNLADLQSQHVREIEHLLQYKLLYAQTLSTNEDLVVHLEAERKRVASLKSSLDKLKKDKARYDAQESYLVSNVAQLAGQLIANGITVSVSVAGGADVANISPDSNVNSTATSPGGLKNSRRGSTNPANHNSIITNSAIGHGNILSPPMDYRESAKIAKEAMEVQKDTSLDQPLPSPPPSVERSSSWFNKIFKSSSKKNSVTSPTGSPTPQHSPPNSNALNNVNLNASSDLSQPNFGSFSPAKGNSS